MTKTALITGASGAIGGAIADMLAEKGYNLVLVSNKHPEKTAALAKRLGEERCLCVSCDISDSTAVNDMFSLAAKRFGGVDILINNAGISMFSLLTDMSDADWHEQMSVNLDGCFYCCRAALPYMVHNKWGRVINVSSVWGVTGGSCECAYSAAKAGVIGLTKALAKEVAPSAITVNCVAPGVIDTPMNSRLSEAELADVVSEIPLGRLGSPGEIAQAVSFLIDCEYMTGQVISPNGGYVV